MILFIFEGKSYEPKLYEGIKTQFFPKSTDQVLCSFCASIYTFYKRLKSDIYGGYADVVNVLKEELRRTDSDNDIFKYKSSDFESVYLFFDYDFYNGNLERKNSQIRELLEYFNEETGNGKLFISYPMIESIQYTKELPDNEFYTYVVSREDSCGDKFKKEAKQMCFYKGYSYLKNMDNWKHIVLQNVQKANMLTTGIVAWPIQKNDVEQSLVFNAQLDKYVNQSNNVAILNAFPLFLYYYFPKEKFE